MRKKIQGIFSEAQASVMGRSQRLIALDTMRGITIGAMILVNNPGSWSHVYPQLRHAAWHGWTLTDLIFPFFLFIVGVSIVFSLGGALERGRTPGSQVRRVVERSVRLVLFGLLLSAWSTTDLANLRIPGVLQRISFCYLAGALIFLYLSKGQRRGLFAVLLAGYWALLEWAPVPGIGASNLDRPEANIAAWFDRLLLDGHLWSQSKTWDPEGILSTVSAVATVLLGLEVGSYLRGRHLRSADLGKLAVGGITVSAAGAALGLWYPINKALWTGSFVLWTGGLAILFLTLLVWVVDIGGWRKWTFPFVVFGRNAITVFVMSGLLGRTFGRIQVTSATGQESIKSLYYRELFTSWLPPDAASLAHAVAWILFCYLVVWLMYRNRVFFRA